MKPGLYLFNYSFVKLFPQNYFQVRGGGKGVIYPAVHCADIKGPATTNISYEISNHQISRLDFRCDFSDFQLISSMIS